MTCKAPVSVMLFYLDYSLYSLYFFTHCITTDWSDQSILLGLCLWHWQLLCL